MCNDFITCKAYNLTGGYTFCMKHTPECSICLNRPTKKKEIFKTKCGHVFHETCIYNWLLENETCPVCRNVVPVSINFDISVTKEIANRIPNNELLKLLEFWAPFIIVKYHEIDDLLHVYDKVTHLIIYKITLKESDNLY